MPRLLSFLWQRFHSANLSRATEIVALFLAFTLATHSFWCAMNFLAVTQTQASQTFLAAQRISPVSAVSSVLSAPQPHTDICCGNADEHVVLNSVLPVTLPELLLVFLPLLWLALLIVFIPLLPSGAMVFGRDGPLSIRPLHSRLVRTSLPHRAPPVLLF